MEVDFFFCIWDLKFGRLDTIIQNVKHKGTCGWFEHLLESHPIGFSRRDGKKYSNGDRSVH